MSRKYIRDVLHGKWSKWVESIEDEGVRKLARQNSFITGGAIVSMLKKEAINDLDIYFLNKETTVAVAEYYADVWNRDHSRQFSVKVDNDDRVRVYVPSAGILEDKGEEEEEEVLDNTGYINTSDENERKKEAEKKKDEKYLPRFVSSNAITLSGDVQLIIRFYGDPDEVHESFDFVHCTNYFIPNRMELVLKQEALESIMFNQLVYTGTKYPLSSVLRAKKFVTRGWKINAGQHLKMMFQTSELNLKDPEVLEEQLIGVDYFYFSQVISLINKEIENDPGFEVTNTYLTEVIDRIFSGEV